MLVLHAVRSRLSDRRGEGQHPLSVALRQKMPSFDALDSDLEIAAKCASPDAGVRRVAMLELADVVDEGAVPLLARGLRDSDATVREAAAKALDEHDGLAAVEALVAALEDPVQAVRAAAAEMLAEKKELASSELLIDRAGHADP